MHPNLCLIGYFVGSLTCRSPATYSSNALYGCLQGNFAQLRKTVTPVRPVTFLAQLYALSFLVAIGLVTVTFVFFFTYEYELQNECAIFIHKF